MKIPPPSSKNSPPQKKKSLTCSVATLVYPPAGCATTQDGHAKLPVVEYVPLAQLVQPVEARKVSEAELPFFPAGHSKQYGLPASSAKSPGAQGVQVATPAEEK